MIPMDPLVRTPDGRGSSTFCAHDEERIFIASCAALVYGIYLTEDLCLFAKRIHLRLHKLRLNFDDVLEILDLAEFLQKCKSSSDVLGRVAQKYSI